MFFILVIVNFISFLKAMWSSFILAELFNIEVCLIWADIFKKQFHENVIV